jgi:hypothetical protein
LIEAKHNKGKMKWDELMIGLIFLILGLIGLTNKPKLRKDQRKQLSESQFIIGSYAVLAAGIFLIIWSVLSEGAS